MADEFDMDKALEQDAARREQVKRNQERAIAQGSVPVMTQERAETIAAAQRLRIELGGYASMPDDVRSTKNVQEQLWPKVVEYAKLRMSLAQSAVCDLLVTELRLTDGEISQLVNQLAGGAGRPLSGPPVIAALRKQMFELEQRIEKLEARPFDTSDVAPGP